MYEWNAAKGRANASKHGVSFEEASTVFLDPFARTFSDPDHSAAEAREITIGYTVRHRIVFVAHCQREDRTRIISARKATSNERKQYEEGTGSEAK